MPATRWIPAALCGLAFCAAAATAAAEPACRLPKILAGRQMSNISDPLYRPDNPHAGRLAIVDFAAGTYRLRVAGSGREIQGTYGYRLLDRHIAEVALVEAFDHRTSHYRLLLTCLDDHGGRFVFTQDDGPVAPRQRQNGGVWSLTR